MKEIKRLRSFLNKFVVTFVWSREVFHPIPASRDPNYWMRDSGIAEVTFSKQIPYSGMKNVPPYYFLKGPLIAKDILVCLTFFLKEVANQSYLKKDSPKFPDYIKRLYVLVVPRTNFRVKPHPIVVWMSKNLLLKAGPKSEV